jgi:predicted nucleic acid-binding protein
MIVLDASAVVEVLLDTPAGQYITMRISDPPLSVHVPHLLDLEVTHVLRRYVRDGLLRPARALDALDDLRALDLYRHVHEPFLDRVWGLRKNLTAYDAIYVALAEILDAPLITCDGRLARAPGLARRVELVESDYDA